MGGLNPSPNHHIEHRSRHRSELLIQIIHPPLSDLHLNLLV